MDAGEVGLGREATGPASGEENREQLREGLEDAVAQRAADADRVPIRGEDQPVNQRQAATSRRLSGTKAGRREQRPEQQEGALVFDDQCRDRTGRSAALYERRASTRRACAPFTHKHHAAFSARAARAASRVVRLELLAPGGSEEQRARDWGANRGEQRPCLGAGPESRWLVAEGGSQGRGDEIVNLPRAADGPEPRRDHAPATQQRRTGGRRSRGIQFRAEHVVQELLGEVLAHE